MVYQSGVGTAAIATMPTNFVSFMSINLFVVTDFKQLNAVVMEQS